jgi:hypothetical protein
MKSRLNREEQLTWGTEASKKPRRFAAVNLGVFRSFKL